MLQSCHILSVTFLFLCACQSILEEGEAPALQEPSALQEEGDATEISATPEEAALLLDVFDGLVEPEELPEESLEELPEGTPQESPEQDLDVTEGSPAEANKEPAATEVSIAELEVEEPESKESLVRKNVSLTQPLDLSPESIVRRTLARYFQTDLDTGTLTLEETLAALASYEDAARQDGILDQREFRATYQENRIAVPGDEMRVVQKLMRGRDPWIVLIEGLDKDGDAAVSSAEVQAFFATTDSERIEF